MSLLAYVGFVIACCLAMTGFLLGMTAGVVESQSTFVQQTKDGRFVDQRHDGTTWIYYDSVTGEDLGSNITTTYRSVPYADLPAGHEDLEYMPPWWASWTFFGFSLAAGLAAGLVTSSLLWHAGWLRRFLVAASPVLLVAVLWTVGVVVFAEEHDNVRRPAGLLLPLYTLGGALLGVLIGLPLGPPLARVLVTTLVPPKPRQALAFLWLGDGKAVPT